MAKKKSRKSYRRRSSAKVTTHRRRRRIGAMSLNPSSPIVKYGSIVLGYMVAAPMIKTQVDKMLAKVTDPDKKKNYEKMIYGGLTLGGAYLGFMNKGKTSLIKSVLAGVAAGAGLKNALQSFGIGSIGGYGLVPALGGYGNVPAIGRRMNGYAPQGTLSGYAPQGTLAGRNVMGSPIPAGMADGGIIGDGNSLMG